MDEVKEPNKPAVSSENKDVKVGKTKPKIKPVHILVVLVLLAAAAAGYFAMQASKYNKDKKTAQSQADSLNKQLTDTKKQLDDAKKQAASSSSTSTKSTKVTISDSLKENIHDAIQSKNTAALEGYMASSVTVVIAASEKGGAESPAQAVADLDYVSGGTAPWNFNIPAATLTTYKNGFYGKYFNENTYAGQSANNYVISFEINASGKIVTVFMTNNAEILTQ